MNTFRHSGKLGDIIYSLPAVKARGGGVFYVDYRTEYDQKPPLGKQPALMMIDLLRTQDYIAEANLYEGQSLTCDLDRFRDKAVAVHIFNTIKAETDQIAGVLFGGFVKELRRRIVPGMQVDLPQCHWECAGLPGHVDLSTPWLSGIPPKPIADIVICRTGRHSGTLDWPRLKEYSERSVFVGLEEEWKAFCSDWFPIPFYKAADLVDFARVVAGAKLYVGNQSFGLALAEAMLIPRVAQLWEISPNRMPPVRAHRALTPEIVDRYINS